MDTPGAPKSNVRFIVIWAALALVLTYMVKLVPALHIAHWTDPQTTASVAEVNALSAAVLAVVAFFWTHSVKEPAALQGAGTAFAGATVLLGASFHWWSLNDAATQLVLGLAGALLVLVLVAFNRMTAYAPETVELEKAKAATPEAIRAAIAPRLMPPATPVPDAPPTSSAPATT